MSFASVRLEFYDYGNIIVARYIQESSICGATWFKFVDCNLIKIVELDLIAILDNLFLY